MFGTIYRRASVAAIAAITAMCLSACEGSRHETSKGPIELTSACELAKGAALDGRLVRFRSGFDLGVEFVRVVDAGCPRINLFLRAADQSIDLTLCSEEGMRFGYPVNPDFNVKATFTGVFRAAKPDGGSVKVVSMTDISGERGPK